MRNDVDTIRTFVGTALAAVRGLGTDGKRRTGASPVPTIGILLLLCVVATGCGSTAEEAPTQTPEVATTVAPVESATPTATPTPEPTPTPDPVAVQIDGMTVEEKVGQLLVAGIYGTTAGSDAVTAIEDYQVGGIILFGRNVESATQLADLNNELKALNEGQIPLFLCVDEEGGLVSRMPSEVTDISSALTFGETNSPQVAEELGKTLALSCATFGFNVDFAPVLDIWSNPANTVIGTRAYGTDADTVASFGVAVAQTMVEEGTIPVVKHFPGHGDTDVDSHYGLPIVEKSVEELVEMEFVPFQSAIDEGLPAIMVGHVLLSAVDEDYPATLSYPVVTELLRGELGFDGVVFTDDLTMAAVADSYGMGEACVLAFAAGCDMLLVCHESGNLTAARDALLDAVSTGRITEERLDESVYRILTMKEDFNLTNEPTPSPDVAGLNEQISDLLTQLS